MASFAGSSNNKDLQIQKKLPQSHLRLEAPRLSLFPPGAVTVDAAGEESRAAEMRAKLSQANQAKEKVIHAFGELQHVRGQAPAKSILGQLWR